MCLFGHLLLLFRKIFIQVFCPFSNRVVCLLVLMLSCMSYLYILDINSLIVIFFANIFPLIRLYFCLDGALSCAKAFSLIKSHFLKLVQYCQNVKFNYLADFIFISLINRDCISYMSHSDDFIWVTLYAPMSFLVKSEVGKIIVKSSVCKKCFCFSEHIKKVITVIL